MRLTPGESQGNSSFNPNVSRLAAYQVQGKYSPFRILVLVSLALLNPAALVPDGLDVGGLTLKSGGMQAVRSTSWP